MHWIRTLDPPGVALHLSPSASGTKRLSPPLSPLRLSFGAETDPRWRQTEMDETGVAESSCAQASGVGGSSGLGVAGTSSVDDDCGRLLSTDWIRGSFGSTPGSEPRTD